MKRENYKSYSLLGYDSIKAAAKELNQEYGLEPLIDTKLPLPKIKELIIEAWRLCEPFDNLTKDTLNVIKAILVEQRSK